MKNLITIILIWCFVMLSAGCPSQKTIQTAKQQSAKFATYANTGVEITRSLFNQRIIGKFHKDQIADAFIKLSEFGIAFDASVARLEATYKDKVPPNEIDALFALFDAQIVAQFIVILKQLKVISADSQFGELISLITTGVLIVAKAFGKQNQIEARLKTV